MGVTVYTINKGINRSIEFKGIKAQYIIYLAAGLLLLLIIFALLYVVGVNTYVSLGIIIPSGVVLYSAVQRFSKRFGEHGLLKHNARKHLPGFVSARSRKLFIQLSEKDYEKKEKIGRRTSHL
ncbi:DUF4133 domain-containing protein [Chitinophaga sp. GbtcB8]|uniref:DUF4133 domain-containing protein n=1 Tax=Chitinophaga sp. GbtcB8 TaxID=2824753 RepID=UPI001C2F7C08|nr:DUF4133 domain-containing protein [Chitinophaga sp. GbtcB8]